LTRHHAGCDVEVVRVERVSAVRKLRRAVRPFECPDQRGDEPVPDPYRTVHDERRPLEDATVVDAGAVGRSVGDEVVERVAVPRGQDGTRRRLLQCEGERGIRRRRRRQRRDVAAVGTGGEGERGKGERGRDDEGGTPQSPAHQDPDAGTFVPSTQLSAVRTSAIVQLVGWGWARSRTPPSLRSAL